MVLISKEFPTRFLSGSELIGKEVPVKIKDIRREKVFSQQKQRDEELLVIYFEGKDRGVSLKKQRANELKKIIKSDNTDDWIGESVILYAQEKGGKDIIHFKASK